MLVRQRSQCEMASRTNGRFPGKALVKVSMSEGSFEGKPTIQGFTSAEECRAIKVVS